MTSIKVMLVSAKRIFISWTMDERDKRRIGEEIEPGGRPKAPGHLELLQRFLNTWNHEFPMDWDRLGTPAKAHAWLRAKGLISASTRVTARDAARLARAPGGSQISRDRERRNLPAARGGRRPPARRSKRGTSGSSSTEVAGHG